MTDVYGPQRSLDAGVAPRAWVLGSPGYLPQLQGLKPPHGVYTHISGIDLLRGPDGTFRVLEDNLRCPSGVSYVLENCAILKRTLPKMFEKLRVASVEEYTIRLQLALAMRSPRADIDPGVVVLTPGPYNSAYFEHSFLARRTGFPLVQPADRFVDKDRVFVKTTRGPRRVDVVYRRIDDLYLDPTVFKPDSALGVPGILGAWDRGNVTLANAPHDAARLATSRPRAVARCLRSVPSRRPAPSAPPRRSPWTCQSRRRGPRCRWSTWCSRSRPTPRRGLRPSTA